MSHGLPDRLRAPAAQLYWDAFRAKLGPILGDSAGPDLLASTFNSDRAIIACAGQALIGLAGLQYGGHPLAEITWRAMRESYGTLRGAMKYGMLAVLDRPNAPDELVMDGIVVDPAYRGKGVGSRLLSEVRAVAKREGFQSVRLDVVDTNPGARRLYERRGFTQTSTTHVPFLRRWLGFGAATTMIKAVNS